MKLQKNETNKELKNKEIKQLKEEKFDNRLKIMERLFGKNV